MQLCLLIRLLCATVSDFYILQTVHFINHSLLYRFYKITFNDIPQIIFPISYSIIVQVYYLKK